MGYIIDNKPGRANKEYLKILNLAAQETETGVDEALRRLFDEAKIISAEAVENILKSEKIIVTKRDVYVAETNLAGYDELITGSRTSVYGGEI